MAKTQQAALCTKLRGKHTTVYKNPTLMMTHILTLPPMKEKSNRQRNRNTQRFWSVFSPVDAFKQDGSVNYEAATGLEPCESYVTMEQNRDKSFNSEYGAVMSWGHTERGTTRIYWTQDWKWVLCSFFFFFRQEKALCANMNRCFKSLAGTSASRSVDKVVQLQGTDFWYWICCSADAKQFLSQTPNQVGGSNKTEQHQTKMNTRHIYHNSMSV